MNERQKAIQARLNELNNEVAVVLAKRRAWMDAHMAEFAKVPIGEDIYDLDTGQRLGKVIKHYRYWADRDPCHDTSMDVHCEYNTHGNCYDNTSRQPGRWLGSRAHLERKTEADLRRLKASAV